ncbi:PQQ-dependent sugar dehydrogenase [Danxiaibacter flavus]|uniref:PQQ-dependent sugar dehydrogenase n=1 Tax=Danxiaibacter flavus TaxID=3049108 RepID=A0ABV3ZJA1_9BACT|nr:PQQ-dependent sugar dehydrogenase [Chitinophagaceae bacterium DXS]
MKKVFYCLGLLSALALPRFASAYAKDTTFIVHEVLNDTLPTAPLTLPSGFHANIIATGLNGARHLTVTNKGDIYVKLSKLKDGKGIYFLKDNNGDGNPDEQIGFGNYPGTGILVKNGYLYASSNDDIYRYKLNDNNEVISPDAPEKIVSGLVNHNRDNSKSLAVDNKGNLYVNVGSYANACLEGKNLTAPMPCPILDSAGGIWKYKTDKADQHFKDGIRYATGLKNVVGLDWNTATNSLFVMQHGRDQLNLLYPQYFSKEQDATLPAETMYELRKEDDAGWPYVYYDQQQNKKILAPEYGGDGKKTGGKKTIDPVVAFPAHLAPNALLFYTGNSFPEKYKHGAFIAFHGKSPELQKGYLIAFVPFKNGKPSGQWEIFADGFNPTGTSVQHKPCGLAQGADGSIYVADDAGGTIYRIQYKK